MKKKRILYFIIYCYVFFAFLFSGYQKTSIASAHEDLPVKTGKIDDGKKEPVSTGKYTIIDGVLTNYDSDDPVVVIPDGVTEIGDYAFSKSTYMEIVIIPNSVAKIGDYAFYGCSLLEELKIPDSVTEIGQYAFSYCSALKKVQLSAGLKTLSPYLFYYCKSLEDISIMEGTEVIGKDCFGHCSQLVHLRLPSSMKNIGFWSLEYCESLKHILIPQNVSSIDINAFAFCKLEKLTIYGDKGTVAEQYAKEKGIQFALTSQYDAEIGPENSGNAAKPNDPLPTGTGNDYPAKNTVFKAGEISYQIISATSNKKNMGKVVLKKSTDKKITSVSIPSSVTYKGFSYHVTQIGANAFKNCKKLKTVTIKTSKLEKIGKNAFYGINKNAVFKCPKKQLSKYKKYLTANTGYKKTMKVIANG